MHSSHPLDQITWRSTERDRPAFPQTTYDGGRHYQSGMPSGMVQQPMISPMPAGYAFQPQQAFQAPPGYVPRSYNAPDYDPSYQPQLSAMSPQGPNFAYTAWPPNTVLHSHPALIGMQMMQPVDTRYPAGTVGPNRVSHAPVPQSYGSTRPPGRSGLPQKPEHTGHTMWVGNIPGCLDNDDAIFKLLQELKDHFSLDAEADIGSVFLIRRSNCAFVNYRTEEACAKAVTRFNQGSFRGARLLCRNKRTEPADDKTTQIQQRKASNEMEGAFEGLSIAEKGQEEKGGLSIAAEGQHEDLAQPAAMADKPKNRYFILKSLTNDDLEDSCHKNSWITQPHVQNTLHDAFQSAENVYLIFSVNKSREYYGYAKMKTSPFDENQVEQPSSNDSLMGVKTIMIRATDSAPPGRIVSDPARDTLFWEAVRKEDNVRRDSARGDDIPHAFKIEWCKTRRIPFQYVKGWKNSLNGDKEVKVARDGTEVEAQVARKVIKLFEG